MKLSKTKNDLEEGTLLNTNIWIDIDDTIANTSDIIMKEAIDYHKYILKKNVLVSDIKSRDYYYFARKLGWNEEELRGFFRDKYPDYLKMVEIKSGVVETINRLRENGKKIHFISSRREISIGNSVYEITVEWLRKHEVKYDSLIINCCDKYSILSSKTGIYIDDSYDNCVAVSKLDAFVVYQMESQYGERCSNKRIKFVKNWNEINEYLT